jgi:hypothetical protein
MGIKKGVIIDYSNFEVLYSFARKLNQDYTGSAFRIIRSSDNAEQNIGFVGNDVDTAAISSFCSGTTGKIHTLYNQGTSGVIYDLVTIVTAKPIIYQSGAIITINGKPAAKTDTSAAPIIRASNIITANGIHDKNGLQKSMVHKRNTTGTTNLLMVLERDNSLTNRVFEIYDDLRSSTSTIPILDRTLDVAGTTIVYPNTQTAGEISINSSDYYVDGVQPKGSALKNGLEFFNLNQTRVWTSTNNRFFDMFRAAGDFIIQEYVARLKATNNKDLAGITAIANEQNSFYTVY